MGENPNPNPEVNPTGEDVTLKKKEYDELVEKLANETQDKSNLVKEIKELREKKQLTESQVQELERKLKQKTEVGNPDDITPERIAETAARVVEEILTKKERGDAEVNRKNAEDRFKEIHKEFHGQNDEAGIKYAAFENKLQRFNLTGLRTEADFLAAFEDAYKLMGKVEVKLEEGGQNPYSTTPQDEPRVPKEVIVETLTPKERVIIDRTFGGDKERYLKIKAKRPDYVESLLQYAR